jgi:predicted AlkP superfamily pyrophosphatase or phosphodiesterase
MYKFTIDKQKPNKKQGYYLELNWMSGDADAYEDSEMGPIKEEDFDSLSSLLDWIDRYVDFDHNSKCDRAYKVLNDWREFVDYWEPGAEVVQNKFTIEWKYDVTCDGYPASLQLYRVFYIDENGKEFSVKVEK